MQTFVKTTIGLLVFVVASVAAAWLAGALFLVFTGLAPIQKATPLTLYSYAWWYGDHPKINAWLWVSGCLALTAVAAPIVMVLLPKTKRSLHGDARWATPAEIRAANLHTGDGIIVAQRGGKLLMHGGTPMISPHVYLAAPTGSGKTQGVMLPNALSWRGSLVALDIKGELFELTAGYRAQHGQQVFCLNFTARDYRTDQYNPFAFVSEDANFLVADVQRIVTYLVQTGKGEDFWPLQARQLFIGIALYFYAIKEVPTLPRIRALALNGDGEGLQKWCKKVLADPTLQSLLHPEARLSLGSFATAPENTAGGIALTLTTGLTPFLNDLTAAVVSGNSCDLRQLRKQAISIYVVVAVADREILSPILRLFFQQLLDLNLDKEFGKDPEHKHLVLLGMDEFASIGKVPAIQESIAYIRSYGMRLLSIVQTPAQLTTVYQQDGAKAFTDNFGCAVFYTPAATDVSGAENLSKMLGYETVKGVSNSRRGLWGWDDKSRSRTVSDQKRALMLPQEIMRLPTKEVILLISGMYPIRGQKPFAAKDRRFADRFTAAPEVGKIALGTPAPEVLGNPQPVFETLTDDHLRELKTLDFSDLTLDFSDIEIPREPVSEAEVEEICAKLYDKIMQPASTSVS